MSHGDPPCGSGLPVAVHQAGGLARAAVVAPLYRHRGVWRLLFIRRADTVAHHRGQYAFPGGRWEPSDGDLWHTAQRETREELGVDVLDIHRLAVLPVQVTQVSGFAIQPFLARISWPLVVTPQRSEVAGLLTPPLAFFRENHQRATIVQEKEGGPCYIYGSCRIWGATARIIHGLIPALAGGLLTDRGIQPWA